MRKVTYAVVAIAATLAVGAPSWAQQSMWNGPQQQNGKCWKNQGPQGMGYWQECPKPAAAPVPTRQPTRTRHS